MKIFISWSGDQSRIIAEGLNAWLPKVIQAVKTFYSPEIEKGIRGIEEINKTLEGTSFGIICLTPENLASTWIHYEAGALSKIKDTRIWTLLFNLRHSDIVQPLAQFQHTLSTKEDIYKLVDSINANLSEPLDKSVLRDSFERWWSDFEEILKNAEKVVKIAVKDTDKNIRTDREILNEILDTMRQQERRDISIKSINEVLGSLRNQLTHNNLRNLIKSADSNDELILEKINDYKREYFIDLIGTQKSVESFVKELKHYAPNIFCEINAVEENGYSIKVDSSTFIHDRFLELIAEKYECELLGRHYI